MKKEKLMRLKALVASMIIGLSLSACSDEGQKINQEEAIVIFIEGKALIYSGEYSMNVSKEYVGIGGSLVKYDEITRFTPGTDAVKVQSEEDAIELATAIVGEENIIYIDYNGEDMKLTYSKINK